MTQSNRIEFDSCGILAVIEKDARPVHDNLQRTIDGLVKMEHRSGFIDGEGDGCGVLTDIPRKVWRERLENQGLNGDLSYAPGFAVAHLFLPKSESSKHAQLQTTVRHLIQEGYQLQILTEVSAAVDSSVLGKNGKADEPLFWQLALYADSEDKDILEARLFELCVDIEKQTPIHVASLSSYTVVYKVMGAASILPKYFDDIRFPSFETAVTIGHNRYSTNTASSFFRVQPFSLLGHNGEINTISKLKEEAALLGVPVIPDGSDSQNVNRTAETFVHRFGLSLFASMERLFPPILNEIKHYPDELRGLYLYLRETWGPFSQGPAGIVSRSKEECLFSVDALGLRPLWMVETDHSLYFSSEQGIVSVNQMVSEPKPLAPGEKIGVYIRPDGVQVVPYHELQQIVLEQTKQKFAIDGYEKRLLIEHQQSLKLNETHDKVSNLLYAAFGWDREQQQLVMMMADKGTEPIRSLGHDGPLAALALDLQNISDFFKESVAVVTNPAIDREREIEHFSTRTVLGGRPSFTPSQLPRRLVEMPSPVLMEGERGYEAAKKGETLSFEEVVAIFGQERICRLPLSFSPAQGAKQALRDLENKAVQAVLNGAQLIILDDSEVFNSECLWLDSHLAVSAVDIALKSYGVDDGEENLRRRVSIILRSGAIRNLHDAVTAIGLGANAVAPYLMFATVAAKGVDAVYNLFSALNKGLEKVISTLGIHELRGYGRLFSAIGLHPEMAEMLKVENYFSSKKASYTWEKLERDAEERHRLILDSKARPGTAFHFFPKLWKSIGQVADGSIPYSDYDEKLAAQEREHPVSLRHLLDLNLSEAQMKNGTVPPDLVDISAGEHDLPFVISSMSFGSQNETAFRAYAEAAYRLNMVSMNGEGGEIKDMLGKYYNNRGHQIASGRFGVTVEMCNSAKLLEIKIGQGAKPGEGGHLPGTKVSAKVAEARNATPGVDLISPSNNHDIYSIEDLAQMITELKTANDEARVIVKVPVVPNIGTIAVGIAKAGADIITLSGFDGGTGAARVHALQHVGLPVEIGVKSAHNALIEAGLRDRVEIWGDGGLKSSLDAVRLLLLGANRVGYGTMAMIAIGCTACRGCHLDTCHVGIATQIDSMEEAEHKGLKHFVPQNLDQAVDQLVRFFRAMGEDMKRIVGQLGFRSAQDLVGRSDLLIQMRGLDRLDLSDLIHYTAYEPQKAAWYKQEAAVLVAAGRVEGESEYNYSAGQDYSYTFSGVHAAYRVLGSRNSGARVKGHLNGGYLDFPEVNLTFIDGSVPGNGLAAYNAQGVNIRVHGGAQDGVGKTSYGGRVSIMKSPGLHRQYINGSVGKSFCYGAQRGLFIVQGNADSRAGIRLSGADIVIGGEVNQPLQDHLGSISARANMKGFAFEYMTNGRAVVLGDPGAWICSGMSGGVVYLRLQPEMGLTREALQRRIAKGAKVTLMNMSERGVRDIAELLGAYKEELIYSGQEDKAEQIQHLIDHAADCFVRVVPDSVQADPSISTE